MDYFGIGLDSVASPMIERQRGKLPAQTPQPIVSALSDSTVEIALPTAPDTGGAPVRRHDLRWSTDGTNWVEISDVGDATSVSGLAALTPCYAQVRAANAFGAGPWSESGWATTAAAATAPTLAASAAWSGRRLTVSVDALSGEPAPAATLAALTLDGVDIRPEATGDGPWVYDAPSSFDDQTVAWTVTADNTAGSDAVSGAETAPADLTAPTWSISGPAAIAEGDALSAGDLSLTIVDPGAPAIGAADITLEFRVDGAAATLHTAAAGEEIVYVARLTGHPVHPDHAETAPPVTVAAAATAPTLAASAAWSGRRLTVSVDAVSGEPAPAATLAALTLDGVDIRPEATGDGPWVYDAPSSFDDQTVAWTVTAHNTAGSDVVSGAETAPADLTAPTWSISGPAAISEGDALSVDDLSLTIVDPGAPAIGAADITLEFRVDGAAATLHTAAAGEEIVYVARLTGHPVHPDHAETAPPVTVAAAATAPAAMNHPDLTGGGGGASLMLGAAPDDGGAAIARYDYEIDTLGGDFSASIAAGQQDPAARGEPVAVAPLAPGDYVARNRAVNAVGVGPWSAPSPAATVTAAASSPAYVDVALDGAAFIQPSDTAPVTDQIVHFHLDAALMAVEAATAATALSQSFDAFDFRRELEVYWRVRNPDGTTYDERAYDAAPADLRFHPNYKTGGGVGPFFAHVFANSGAHAIEVTAYFRNRKYTIARTITVAARAFSNPAVYDPDGDFTDAPAGAQFSDVDAFFTAMKAQSYDTFYMRAGKAASKTAPTSTAVMKTPVGATSGVAILPWGGAAGDKINIDTSGISPLDGAELITLTGDGVGVFSDLKDGRNDPLDLSGGISVYVDNVRADPADYTKTTTTAQYDGIAFTANIPAQDAVIRIFGRGGKVHRFTADGSANYTSSDDPNTGNWNFGAPGATLEIRYDGVIQSNVTYTVSANGGQDCGRIAFLTNGPTTGQEVEITTAAPTEMQLTGQTSGITISLNGQRCLVKDVNVVGNYDPEDPDAFDPDDLTTYGVNAEAGGINFNGPNCQHATVLDTHVSGVRTAFGSGSASDTGRTIGIVNCKVDGWNDYGAFLESFPQVCIIGCYFGQKPGAYNHTGKVWNVPTRPNTPNHGALRIPDTVQTVLQRNVFRTLNTWSAGILDLGAQPSIRAPQSSNSGQSGASSENVLIAGSSQGIGGGPANAENVAPSCDVVTSANNIHIVTELTGAFLGGGMVPYASFNDVIYSLHGTVWDDTRTKTFSLTGSGDPGSYFEGGGYDKPRLVISPTVYIGIPAAATFTALRRSGLLAEGLNNLIGHAVAAGGSTSLAIPFDFAGQLADKRAHCPRIYFLPAAQMTGAADSKANQVAATSFPTTGEMAAVYDLDLTGIGGPSTFDGALLADFDYGKPKTGTVVLTMRDGSAPPAGVYFLTSTNIEEAVDRFDLTGAKEAQRPPGVNGYTFALNQGPVGGVQTPLPQMYGELIIIRDDESFAGYRRTEDDALIDATGALVDTLREAHWAPLSGDYQKPGTGSAAVAGYIPAADQPRAHRDLLWRERPAAQTLGAIEVEATNALDNIPAMMQPVIFSAAWASGVLPLTEGDTLNAASVTVSETQAPVPDPGVAPNIRFVDVDTDLAETPWYPEDLPATVNNLAAGDLYRFVVQEHDPTTGARHVQSAYAGVIAASYQPHWWRNNDGTDFARWTVKNGLNGDPPPVTDPDAVVAYRMRFPVDPSGYNEELAMFGNNDGGVRLKNGNLETRPAQTVFGTVETGDEISLCVILRDSVASPTHNFTIQWSKNGVRQPDHTERVDTTMITAFALTLGLFNNGRTIDISDWLYVGTMTPEQTAPGYGDFFESDHTPKQILADLTLGGKATCVGFSRGQYLQNATLNLGSNPRIPDLQTDHTNAFAWTDTGDVDASA